MTISIIPDKARSTRYLVRFPDGTHMRVVANEGGIITEIGAQYRHLWGEHMPLVREFLEARKAVVKTLDIGERCDYV